MAKAATKGARPDFNVYVSQKGKDEKNFYTQVGSGWNVAKDGISIALTALPVDGRLVLFPRRDEK